MIFEELTGFSRQLEKLRSDHLIDAESYRDLQNALIDESTRIDRIRGTGGLQKARWKTLQGGASGGLRVIYYHMNESDRYLMLAIYKKGRQDKLSSDQRKRFKELVRREIKQRS